MSRGTRQARSWGSRTRGRLVDIATCMSGSTSTQCAGSMPSAARIPKVSAMATPAVPINWRRWEIDRSAEFRFSPVRSAGAARFAVCNVASDARCVGVPSRRPESTAKRITTRIRITRPTRAIHSASSSNPPWHAEVAEGHPLDGPLRLLLQ